MPTLLGLAALSLSACAANQSAGLIENGYKPGALAVAAIDRGDWAEAETLLMQQNGVGPTIPPGSSTSARSIWRPAGPAWL
jgi:hypothetical protein